MALIVRGRRALIGMVVVLVVLSALPTLYTLIALVQPILRPDVYGTELTAGAYLGAWLFFVGPVTLPLLAWHVWLFYYLTRPTVKKAFQGNGQR